jgi:hypothetical protein
MQKRSDIDKVLPYFFLLLLYGWIVFHNLVLFDGYFLKSKKRQYLVWTSLAMFIFSINMYFIVRHTFDVENSLPYILNFWLYTFLGLGVYMTYRYVSENIVPDKFDDSLVHKSTADHCYKSNTSSHSDIFTFRADGSKPNS